LDDLPKTMWGNCYKRELDNEKLVGCNVTTPKGKGVITIPRILKDTGIKRLIERALWSQGVRLKLNSSRRSLVTASIPAAMSTLLL
jgi:hypothetical protein